MIRDFKFVKDNGYSIENPRAFIGIDFEPIVNKINELIKVINKLEKEVEELKKREKYKLL